MRLIGNGKVFTRNNEQPYIEDGAVLIQGNLIKDIEYPLQYVPTDAYAQYHPAKHDASPRQYLLVFLPPD